MFIFARILLVSWEDYKQRRQRWVEALKAGNNPFTPEELEALRQDEG
jgi:hypothetical protein